MIILIGLGLIGLVILGYFYPKTKNNIKEMTNMETKTISELKEIFGTDPDNKQREFVEIKGKANAENLLVAPYSKREVVYFECEVEREYRDYESGETKTEHMSTDKCENDIIINDSSSEEFVVVDITKKCKLDIPVTYNKYERQGMASDVLDSIISISGLNKDNTLGYKIKERTIDANQDLYVIGEAYLDGEKIHIGKPIDAKKPFIVTTKSEEDFIRKSKRNSIIQLVVGIGLIIAGVVLAII